MQSHFFALLAVFSTVNAGLITNLPGAPSVTFKQYAGYYDVGKNHHLHYWFTESQSQPSTDPVILWLTGGPGCSSISALLNEIGPLEVNPDGKTLSVNPWAWNRKANLLILESPAGVGFSYAEDGNVTTDDRNVAIENRQALVAFFKEFTQYQINEFYVTGESYAGMYVPTLVQEILDGQADFHINIKGLAIGNGEVKYDLDTDTLMQYAYNHGMVDELSWRRAETECCHGTADGCDFHSFSGFGFCYGFVDETINNCWYGGLNPYNMFDDCRTQEDNAPLPKRFIRDAKRKTGKAPPTGHGSVLCLNETAVTLYINQPSVRAALFVPQNLPEWSICNDDVGDQYGRLYDDMSSRVQNAVKAGLRALLYNGDGDMACNFLMGQRFCSELGYPVTSPKTPFNVGGQVAGWHTQYGNVEFISVRGAGHMVPTDKPEVAFHILDAFLNHQRP